MAKSYHKMLTLQPKYPIAAELLNKSGPNYRLECSAFSENCVSKYYVGIGMLPFMCRYIPVSRKIKWKDNKLGY